VIDPGYDFLNILNRKDLKLGIQDIDMVIITHDHPDHCAELENIITLLYEI
jgi:glyoxylase-like metal-dependent hydrolase (beta-lactamase superfamily II)